jgi:phage repressor protein C with HTH and peptisase S24 domain
MTHEEEEQFHIQAEMERTDPVAIKYLMRIAEHKREMRDYEPEVNSTRHPLSRIYSDHMRPIPIINRVGSEYPEEFADPAYLAEIMGQYLMVPDVRDPNAFAFYVFGDTMAPDFPNKTLLISSPNTMAIEGDPCFIHFSPTSRTGGCVFRQIFFTRSQQIRLVPINRHYAEEVYDAQDFLMICPVIRMYGKIIRSEEDQKIGKRLSAISKPYSSQTV